MMAWISIISSVMVKSSMHLVGTVLVFLNSAMWLVHTWDGEQQQKAIARKGKCWKLSSTWCCEAEVFRSFNELNIFELNILQFKLIWMSYHVSQASPVFCFLGTKHTNRVSTRNQLCFVWCLKRCLTDSCWEEALLCVILQSGGCVRRTSSMLLLGITHSSKGLDLMFVGYNISFLLQWFFWVKLPIDDG